MKKNKLMLGNISLKNIFWIIIKLALSYLRSVSFITSAMMIFFIFAVVQIFLQDKLDMNALGQIIIALKKIPIIKGYIGMPNGSYNEKDIASFFLRLSFVFMIFTEIIYYIKRYLLKKEPTEMKWSELKRRALLVVAAITMMLVVVFSYIVSQDGDVFGGILIFAMFWSIAIASSLAFLLFDFLEKVLEKDVIKETERG